MKFHENYYSQLFYIAALLPEKKTNKFRINFKFLLKIHTGYKRKIKDKEASTLL